MEDVYVHPHALIHGLSESDIREAWSNWIVRQARSAPQENQIVAIGFSRRGLAIQMVAVVGERGILVIHAMTPPTRGVLKELGIG